MRLICPSCQSEYDVDAAAIGDKGRMVRCANCGGEWFQAPEAEEAGPPEIGEAPVVDGYAAAAAADNPDEAAAEAAEDPGYRIVEETPTASVTYDETPPVERSFPATDDDYMPNRYAEARDTGALAASLQGDEDVRPASGKGVASFFGGFATSAVLVGLFVAVYVAAPSIVSAVPALESAMDGYVGVVEQGRTVLSVLVGG